MLREPTHIPGSRKKEKPRPAEIHSTPVTARKKQKGSYRYTTPSNDCLPYESTKIKYNN
jgi:hypothetical protein